MAEIKDITGHKDFTYRDDASDDLYEEVMSLVQKYAEQGAITATDAVGVLQWATTTIIVMNTDFGGE
jgi:hypothetical protein